MGAPARLPADDLLRHADRAMILTQRLTEWIVHAPDIEEDLAMANIGLDLLGQARSLYTLVGAREGEGRTEDDFAYRREPAEFRHPALVEQPNGDFAATIVRQFLHDAYAIELWRHLASSDDTAIAHLAAKVVKETTYHLRYSRGWLIRLGDGTDESHRRMQAAIDTLWPLTPTLFSGDDALLRQPFDSRVREGLAEATLSVPPTSPDGSGDDVGSHPSAELVAMLTEMQALHRAHPGATW